jgi:hypothetical protein
MERESLARQRIYTSRPNPNNALRVGGCGANC